MDLSIVLPIFNERENLSTLVTEIEAALDSTGKSYEIIAVDDGSRDGTTELLKELSTSSSHTNLRAIFFRTNAGQTAAFDAGFRAATGDVVVTMDADLQNDPKDIPMMLAKLDEGFDVVTGWRKQRKDGFILRRIPSYFANLVIRMFTGTQVHDLGCSLRAYRRHVTDEMKLYGETHRFIAVIADALGARVGEVPVHHRPRKAGRSKYGLTRTVKVLLDLITITFLHRYQTKPIYVFGGLSMLMFTVGSLLSCYVLWEKYDEGVWVHRNPLFMIAVVLYLGSFQFIGTGVLAEMIVRTYYESQGRTPYSIASRIGFDRAAPTRATTSEEASGSSEERGAPAEAFGEAKVAR